MRGPIKFIQNLQTPIKIMNQDIGSEPHVTTFQTRYSETLLVGTTKMSWAASITTFVSWFCFASLRSDAQLQK